MPKRQKHAAPDTLFGQLQRGRGEGCLRILEVPTREAWDLLVDCVCNDPRLDRQVEDRAEYYASIAIETELPLEPLLHYIREYDDEDQHGWHTALAIQTLGEMAKRSYRDADGLLCDYIGWGEWWDWPLDNLCGAENPILNEHIVRKIEERFPLDSELEQALAWFDLKAKPWSTLARHSARITNLKNRPRQIAGQPVEASLPDDVSSRSVQDILNLADKKNSHRLRRVIKQVVKPSDLDVLKEHISIDQPYVTAVALSGIARLAPTSVLPWLIQFWSANPSMPGFLRTRVCEVIAALP
ncbi:MAG TPA: hypothetical protein VLT36_08430, partial [Candidatus Dormibacteraeota bacterium]|nr:hypothetical protein [Candidatus Dormibacteraeota bacterium]